MMLRFKKIAGVILIGILPLISLSLFQVTNAEPHTEVGGPIATDTTWTLSNSPYEVVESIDVWEEATLTIEPGVILKFHAGKGMRINGELIASGSSNNPIIFTSNLDDPSPGDWGDIVFSSTATKSQIDENENYLGGSILQHCIVEYAGSTFVFSPKSAISAQSLYVDNCTVRNNSIRGISNVGSSTEPSLISNSIFQNNHPERGDGGAVYLTYGTISNSVIEDNSSNLAGGIFASNSLITNNLIQNNSSSFGGGLNAENSEIVGNKILDNESGSGGGIRAFNSTIKDNLIVDNSSEGSGGGILANDSVIESNTILNNGARNEGGGIVGGSNDILNNMIIGNTARRGAGISGNDRIISNTIAFNRSFLLVGVEDGPGIFYESFSGDQGEIFYNTIVDNYASGSDDEEIVGAITTSSFGNTPKINYNNIFNNTDY
ncbi:MAG: right-handed parallel beta-helix repeat-containing protein, partial [Chloroflexota bacterium]